MKSKIAGKNTLPAEITNITSFGIWILIHETEYYLPYSEFPWFKDAKLSEILNLQLLNDRHLFWPELDIDLDVSSLNNLEKYPLRYQK